MVRGISHPKRGEIYLTQFDPSIGTEIRKTRPAVVIQNDDSNETSPITIVAAITSRFDQAIYPTEVFVEAGEGGLGMDSVILVNQIHSFDRGRFVRKLGMLKPSTVERLDRALMISFGLIRM